MKNVAYAVCAAAAAGLAVALFCAAPALSDAPSQSAPSPVAPVQVAAADSAPADAAYVLIGADPADRFEIEQATIENGMVTGFEKVRLSQVYRADDGGFMLLRVTAGEQLAIRATWIGYDKLLAGPRFKPCGQTLAFSARPGTVAYVAHVSHDVDDDDSGLPFGLGAALLGVSTHFNTDLGSARAYLARVHPALAERPEQARVEKVGLPRQFNCGSPF